MPKVVTVLRRRTGSSGVVAVPVDLSLSAITSNQMSMLPPMRDRLHLARRAARLRRLGDAGMPHEAAERAVAAWEAEAASRGLPRDDSTYWDAGEAWMLAQRRRWR